MQEDRKRRACPACRCARRRLRAAPCVHAIACRVRSVIESTNTYRFVAIIRARSGYDVDDMLVVGGREKSLRVRGWIHAADEACNVSRILEGANRDRVARPALERLHAGFKVDDDRFGRRQCARERCLADTRRPEDRDSCLCVRDGETLVSCDNPEAPSRHLPDRIFGGCHREANAVALEFGDVGQPIANLPT